MLSKTVCKNVEEMETGTIVRIKLTGVLLVTMLLFSSCVYSGGGIENLLRPPRLNEEQNEIWVALNKNLSSESIKLIYPQKGDNRSAFLLTNLDDEPTEEAVVFFQPVSTTTVANPIRMNILDKVNGAWESMHDIVLEGSQLEDVTVMNIGTGVSLLAVGLNHVGEGGNLLKIIGFDGKTLDVVYSHPYQAKAVYDFSESGKDDILLVDNRESEVKTLARLIVYENGRFSEMSSTLMNPEVTRYGTATKGYLRNGKQALYLDCYKGTDMMTTEILSYEKLNYGGKLLNLTYDGETPQKYPIDRPSGVSCYDLSRDGVIEVPGLVPLPGYEQAGTGALYMVNWYHFMDGEFKRQQSSYMNYSLGYLLAFPERWVGRVSARKTNQANEILFYQYLPDTVDHMGEELLYFRVAKRSEWEGKRMSSEYELIDTRGQIVYLARIPEGKSGLRVSIAQVKENFSRMI